MTALQGRISQTINQECEQLDQPRTLHRHVVCQSAESQRIYDVVLCLVSLDSPRSVHERVVAGRSSLPWAQPLERAPTNGDMYLSATLIKFSLWLSAYKNPSFWSGLRGP